MHNGGLVAALALLVASCGGAPGDAAPSSAPQSATGATGMAAPADAASEASASSDVDAPPAQAVNVKETNGDYEFSYAYPAKAAAIPGLKAELDRRLAAARSETAKQAREDKASAAKDGYPFHAHYYSAEWQVVTDLPGWLSLSASIATFTGGAHGMTVPDALVWDKQAAALREPLDLFVSKDALRNALQPAFCNALDKERAKRRGGPITRGGDEMFTDCIDPAAQTVILGSSNGRTFDRIGFLIAPYEAGPYAEGSYEVTLPVNGKMMATVRPPYRSSFAIGR